MNISSASIRLILLLSVAFTVSCSRSDDAGKQQQQATPVVGGATAAPAHGGGATLPSYPATTQPGRILAGDLLGLQLSGLAGPGTVFVFPKQVAEDGTITIPYVSKPLAVVGKTRGDVEQAIVATYREENVIQTAQVQVRRLRIAGTGGPPPGPIALYDLVRCTIGELSGPRSQDVFIERVGWDGTISLPYTGRQKLTGLTDQMAEAAIARTYHDQNIVSRPCVSVLRLEAAPPDASKVDLPDIAIEPIPESLRWLYEQPQQLAEERTAK